MGNGLVPDLDHKDTPLAVCAKKTDRAERVRDPFLNVESDRSYRVCPDGNRGANTLCPSRCFGPGSVLYMPYSRDGVYVVEAGFSMLQQYRAMHLGVVGPRDSKTAVVERLVAGARPGGRLGVGQICVYLG